MPSSAVDHTKPGLQFLIAAYGDRMRERLTEGFGEIIRSDFADVPAEDFLEMCRIVARCVRLAGVVSLGDFERARTTISINKAKQQNHELLEKRKGCKCRGVGLVLVRYYRKDSGRVYESYLPCLDCNPNGKGGKVLHNEVLQITAKEFVAYRLIEERDRQKGVDRFIRIEEFRKARTRGKETRRPNGRTRKKRRATKKGR